MARHKDQVWNLPDLPPTDQAALGLLMDIRDELKEINRHLKCGRYEERRAESTIVRMDKRLQIHLPLKKKRKHK